MATIKAPFNFVPLSEKVYFPDWADKISQDIPFEDGVSGTIELKITAETPIFVRNGHTREDADVDAKNDNYKSFSKAPDGKYFIPATSIKGAIRNVLEIMSFGKMSRIANNRYSIRDLQLKNYLSFFQNSDIHCGWLSINGETATITDNGIPRRISHKDIDEKFGTEFCKKFEDRDFLKTGTNRSPIIKHEMIGRRSLVSRFKELPLNPNNFVDKRIKVVFDKKGQEGTIVFTGQPSFRKPAVKNSDGTIRTKASGKFYEFVFLSNISQKYTLNTEEENGVYKDFCFIYKDSEEWKFWKQKMKTGESVPVFFCVKNGKLLHFGLSYLYKLPYKKRMKEYLYDEHKKDKLDLSECIFGSEKRTNSLRGRVQFSNAFCDKVENYPKELSPYLGSPKPTYYPMYIKQEGNNGEMVDGNGKGVPFSTMLDEVACLKGWKRYPVQESSQTEFEIPENQDKNTNPFIPLNTGSEFKCCVRFHNLKRIELGALLSAIILRNGYSHSIGFAKPYGYGKVSIKVESISGFEKTDIENLENEFKNIMTEKIPNYTKSSQIKELQSMMHSQVLTTPLEYMDLKEFVNCKKQHFKDDKNQTFGEYLQEYSSLINQQRPPIKTENLLAIAVVSFFDRNIRKAKLIDGKDLISKELIVEDTKIKLKNGDRIEVEKIMKGGNVQKLKLIRKV